MTFRAPVAALGLALAAACRRPDPPVPWPLVDGGLAAQVETREVQLAGDFITVRLHVPPTAEARKPTVISMLGDRSMLLRQGLLVATYRVNWNVRGQEPEPSPSGNVVGEWFLASPSAGVLGRRYLRTIVTTADEVLPKIVDWLVTVPDVDPRRLAIAGSSTNGFVALQAIARDRRLAAGVVLSACGDDHLFLRDSSMGMRGAPLALDPDYDRWLRQHEVVRHPQRVTHAAVLMVNRDADPVIPFSCAERTADVLRRAYARAGVPERFRFTVFHSDKHGLDARDGEETSAWLARWLQAPAGHEPGAAR